MSGSMCTLRIAATSLGFAQYQQILEAAVGCSTVGHELELERPPARFAAVERHRLAQQSRVHDR